MTLSWADFCSQRKDFSTQYFPYPGATRTILFASHIWWTDQMALTLRNLGYNVLAFFPFYLLYSDPAASARFHDLWQKIVANIREANVCLMIGGNSSAIAPHPRTGELLHEAAGKDKPIPLVNWWWDEVRYQPPFTLPIGPPDQRTSGFTPADYVRFLKNDHMLHAIWDIDVKEELEAQFGLRNLFHLPLATMPESWPHGYVPLEDRPLASCFLGNCHFTADWTETDDDPLMQWARDIVSTKLAAPDTPMQTCADRVTTARGGVPQISKHLAGGATNRPDGAQGDPWIDFIRPWDLVNASYMHRTRNLFVKAVGNHLKGKLCLIGKGWDKMGLHANMEHARDKSGVIYGQSLSSLNLFGGCVHGGMPLRPYDIGVSGGLILTHYQRELPSLFEDGRECLSFRTPEEMIAHIDHVRAAPREFNAIALAGRKRVLAQHTWTHRMKRLLAEVEARFGAL